MASYSIQEESEKILKEVLLKDPKLDYPESWALAAQKVKFVGDDSQPFIPTPLKITESSSALHSLLAVAASVASKDRYGVDYQDIKVNTDIASLFLMGFMLPTIKGKSVFHNEVIMSEVNKGDPYLMGKPIHRQCTNVYQTRDGRWYHLHGSMNASTSMNMMGVPEQDVSREEAIEIYKKKVAEWDSATIDRVANDEHKQAGVICNTPEEFFSSEHGRIMGEEPLYRLKPLKATRKPWPAAPDNRRPLEGIRVVDFTRVIAGPVISKMLALLGADVLKVTASHLPDISTTWVDINAGKRDCDINLKTEEGKESFRRLIADADVLLDGYRPGVLERLGFNSDSLREINPSLIYIRENCYGFKGPLQGRSGWQQISDCLVGLSWLQGRFLGLDEPVVPLLPNADYQMGLAGATAVVDALIRRAKEDVTFDIDISLTQYDIWYYRLGQYTAEQQKQLLERNKGLLNLRHYDEMASLIDKMLVITRTTRPDLFSRPEYFTSMSGKEWGVDDDIMILAPAVTLDQSTLAFKVPSGSRGRSKPEW